MSRLVDVHAHYIPDFYRQALIDAGHEFPDGSPIPEWDEELHAARLRELGLDAAVLSLSSPGVGGCPSRLRWRDASTSTGATWRAGIPGPSPTWRACPSRMFRLLAPRRSGRSTTGGAVGIGLLTNYDGIYLGAPEFEPLLKALDDHHATVVIHPTSPKGAEHLTCGRPSPVIEYLFETTRAVTDLLLAGAVTAYPHIQWVVLHNGAAIPSVIDRVSMFASMILHADADPMEQLRSMVFEIGSSTPFPRTAQSIATLAGSEQLVLGTDTPYAPTQIVAQNISRILAGELDQIVDIDRISSTAARLFPALA